MRMKYMRRMMVLVMVLCLTLSVNVLASDLVNPEVVAENAIVASAHPLASQAGIEILQRGGNAVDAAVATAFAIGVVEPNASGLGGEGMMLIHLADGTNVAIDYRSCAPKEIEKYDKERYGAKSVAIPGTVAGLTKALEEYGTMKLWDVMQPAIRYAEDGFEITPTLGQVIMDTYETLLNDPASADIFLEDSFPKKPGDLLVQEDLANTLRLIALEGSDVFYKGIIAEDIAREMEKSGGIITKEDLANYEAIVREPVQGSYRGYDIISSPPPVSGMVVIEALHILENFNLRQYGYLSYDGLHLMSEAVRLAYRDRYSYMADPGFVDVPLDILLDKTYAYDRSMMINMDRQLTYEELRPGLEDNVKESPSTTHLVVADKEGNMVSLTQTISSFFGAGYTVPGLGIVMNNEMKNFSSSGINAMEPYKRMRTTIAPTIMLKNGQPFLTIGTPGAARICPAIVNIIVNVVDYEMGLQEAIEAPRFYSRLGQTVALEGGIPELVVKALEKKGYDLDVRGDMDLYFGGAQGAMYDLETGLIYGGADPRRDGVAEGF